MYPHELDVFAARHILSVCILPLYVWCCFATCPYGHSSHLSPEQCAQDEMRRRPASTGGLHGRAGALQLVFTPILLELQWDVPKVVGKSRDLQGKHVGSLGGGAIGSLVMERLKVISDSVEAITSLCGDKVPSTPRQLLHCLCASNPQESVPLQLPLMWRASPASAPSMLRPRSRSA